MLDEHDSLRLHSLLTENGSLTSGCETAAILPQYAGSLDLFRLAERTRFDHVAILVFPGRFDDVGELLRSAGWKVREPIPSFVVRQRLAERYSVSPDKLDVKIIRGSRHVDADVRQEVEIFALERSQAEAAASEMITAERARETESHIALCVRRPSAEALDKLRNVCQRGLSMTADGGGYNPHDYAESGGRSVLYFRLPAAPARSVRPRYQRLELTCAGHHPDVIAAHLSGPTAGTAQPPGRAPLDGDPARQLLWVLTGHWAARAVHAAAALRIPDVLGAGPMHAEEVARRTASDTAAITRLLRYLAYLGVVRALGSGRYANSAMGDLIREDSPFHDLVRLYGEEFYQAWSHLLTAVRSGSSAFGHEFGMEHFDYFARHTAIGDRFDRAMSAVTGQVCAAVSEAFDFPRHCTVADLGGGNGALLRTILRSHPTARGIIFERDSVAGGAVTDEDRCAYQGRLTAVAGDFFTAVTSGCDIYVLSRILHDWDDRDCLRILQACRKAVVPSAVLLIIERLLPDADDGRDCLALPWDMQMLAITGGRERGQSEYAGLLSAAGFRLDHTRPLPLDMDLLVARPV